MNYAEEAANLIEGLFTGIISGTRSKRPAAASSREQSATARSSKPSNNTQRQLSF